MTEEEWNRSSDPNAMLAFVRASGRLTDRKARLFAVACCRIMWPHLPNELSQQAIEIAEEYADGDATDADLRRAHNALHAWVYMLREAQSWWGQWLLGLSHTLGAYIDDHWAYDFPPVPSELATLAAVSRRAVSGATRVVDAALHASDHLIICCTLRDLFDAAEHPVARQPAITVLAGDIYTAREFSRLPELATRLEASGCTDAALLDHLRGPGPHFRGCWGVDALLARA